MILSNIVSPKYVIYLFKIIIIIKLKLKLVNSIDV